MSAGRFAVLGEVPERIAVPASVPEAVGVVREVRGQALVPWGGGTRQHIGYAPARYDLALSTEQLNAITDHQPADMTVTAEAGVTLADLQSALAARGQWLPIDAALPAKQTVGGIVAARAHSLRRFAFGNVRDSLIGVSVINAEAELIKGGGRVVKNVAGYDLPKLYCGSWGTLGLIVEATFKVAPLPSSSATVVMPLDADRNCEELIDDLLASELTPTFLALLNPLAAQAVLGASDNAQFLFVGFDGSEQDVDWQLATLGADGILTGAVSSDVRAALRDFPARDAPMTCVFHILSSQVGAYVRMLEWTALRAGFSAHVMADAAVGIVWAHFAPAQEQSDWSLFYPDLADKASRVGGSFIIERMPDELRALNTPVWSPVLPDFALMQALKARLDPTGMWNPGRFAGRI